MTATTIPSRKSAWIPWVFVGAMLVVVIVNAIMITFAVSTFSGLSVEKPYERGLQYNQVLEAQDRQDALGWTMGVRFETTGDGLDGRLLIDATGADGAALAGLTIEKASLVRPLEPDQVMPLQFDYAGDGRYVARAVPSKPGQWELHATLRRGDDVYLLIERLIVK